MMSARFFPEYSEQQLMNIEYTILARCDTLISHNEDFRRIYTIYKYIMEDIRKQQTGGESLQNLPKKLGVV